MLLFIGPYDGLSGTGHFSYKNSFERNKITKLFNNELRWNPSLLLII